MSIEYKVYISSNIYNKFEDTLQDLKVTNLFNELLIHKLDEGKQFFMFCNGSIRGLSIRLDRKLLKQWLVIRINAFSSSSDGELFIALISSLINKSKIKVYEESSLLVEDSGIKDYLIARMKKEQEFNYTLMERLLEKESYMTLPIFDYDIVIYKNYFDTIMKDSNLTCEIEKYLIKKSYEYMTSRRAGVITLKGNKTVAVWSFDGVLLSEVDYIAIIKGEDTKNPIFVKWDIFIEYELVRYDQIPKNKNDKYYYIYGASIEDIDRLYDYFVGVSSPLE